MMRYPEYKESGVEWIGKIPHHWRILPFTHCLKKVKTQKKTSVPKMDYQESGEFPVIDQGASFVAGWTDLTDSVISDNLPVVIFGDHTRIFKYVDFPFVLGADGTQLLYPNDDILNTRFFYYALLNLKIPNEGYSRHYRYLREFSVVCPALPTQCQIANFLDRKTGQIDELIRLKERRIELLQAQRTALINQAVTKGLDPNVEMKPSGMEWIGKIPAHWEIIKLRYLGVLQNGISKDSDSFGLGYPFLSYGDVYNNETLPTQVEGLVKSTKADRERYSVLERDIFFTRTSETIEEIGISSTCMKTIENCVFSGFLIRFRSTSKVLTKEFSKYYFPSHLPRIFLAREMNIVTRSSLSQELLKRLPVPFPPIDEQKEIAIFLDEQTQKIDSMVEKENKQIQLLKEYRQSLISEAVTGKIDVRNEV